MKTVALYARISTNETRQHAENQILEMRAFCRHREWEIVEEYVEAITGTVGPKNRSELVRLFADAHRGRFQAVLVFALDRLTRKGIQEAFLYIQRFTDANVEFHSVTEPQFCTSGVAADLMIAIAAWTAKQESEQISKRVAAGLSRAKANGVHIGRHKRVFDTQKALELHQAGLSWHQVAVILKVPKATVRRRALANLPPVVDAPQSTVESIEDWKKRAS